jgi:uracil-DNA glycosylase
VSKLTNDKQKLLQALKERMLKDESLPLKKGSTNLVFGVGDSNSKILFIGEGPGYWEDQKGEPFVGNAGKLLDSLLQSIKLDRTNVYITNVVHHRPPNNRDPEPFEISAYAPYLDSIMEIISPGVVVTLGRFSMGKFLPGVKITAVHGKLFSINWKGEEITVIPMFHPAAGLRSSEVLRLLKEDFIKLQVVVNELKEENKGQQMTLI